MPSSDEQKVLTCEYCKNQTFYLLINHEVECSQCGGIIQNVRAGSVELDENEDMPAHRHLDS